MKHQNEVLWKREDGSIILLFAGCLVLLIFFVGIAIDLSLANMQRNDLENLCQVLRQDRFTYQDTIRYGENPGAIMYQIVSDTMADNQFDGAIKVYFCEQTPAPNYRYYRTRIQLSEEYSFYFLRLFGADNATISVQIDGAETYGEGMNDMIWHPKLPLARYNGSYTGVAGGDYTFVSGDIPTDW